MIAVVVLILTGCMSSPPARKSTPPNIVFVLVDDLSWNLVQFMPHLLAMQKAGTTLSKFYVVDSLCCPSRSALLTGEYPHDNGVFTNSGDDGGVDTFNRHGNEPKTFGVALQNAGYRTGFMGKYLNGYEPNDKPPPGWDEWAVGGNAYAGFNYDLNENGSLRHYGKEPGDYLTDVLSDKAVSFIGRAASSGKPFMLQVAPFTPHRPGTAAPRHADEFAGLTAPRTAAYGKQPSDAPAWLKAIPALTVNDGQAFDREYRRRAQSVLAIDDMIGRIQHELTAKGLAKNTYLVFSSDNGYHLGEHQLRPGKQTAFDTDIHVPLIVTGPGVPANRSVTHLASSVDLAPTFERLAGAKVPSTVDGISLLPLWQGQAPADWQRAVLIEHHGPNRVANDPDRAGRMSGNPPSYEAIRTATALYVQYGNGEREYYDTATDPDQLHNIAATATPAQLVPLQRALSALEECHNTAACQAAARVK